MEQHEVTEMHNAKNLVMIDAQQRAIEHWESARQFRRHTLEEVWKCGQALAEVKVGLPHGEWMPWLKSVGIAKSTAHRWIRFSTQCEMSQIETFGSVDAALKALPPARRKLKESAEEQVEHQESPADAPAPLVGNDELPKQNEAPIPDAPEVDEELETELTTAPVSDGEPDDHGNPEMPTDIEGAQAKIRLLRERLCEMEDQLGLAQEEIAELRRENDRLMGLLEEKGLNQVLGDHNGSRPSRVHFNWPAA